MENTFPRNTLVNGRNGHGVSLLESFNLLLANTHIHKNSSESRHDEIEDDDQQLKSPVANEAINDDGNGHEDGKYRLDNYFAHQGPK